MEDIDASPGLSNAALTLIQQKPAVWSDVCLMLDGMHIKRHISMDNHTNELFGYVDLGKGPSSTEEASEVLVLMVVSLKLHGRTPIGYFLINGVSGEVLADLITNAIIQLHARGSNVRCITMDGLAANVNMCKVLGCKFGVALVKPFFNIPGLTHNIYVYFDPCHMMKLVRNHLCAMKEWVTPSGIARWQLIVQLHEIQNDIGLSLGNKLTRRHLNFENNKMKVSYAVQVLSSSVANSLEILEEFGYAEDTDATVDLLKVGFIYNEKY